MNFLQKLLGREKEIPPPSAPLNLINSPLLAPRSNLPPGLHVGRRTDVGRQREMNQDSLYTFTSFIQSDDAIETFGVFIVADGMGGYKGGEKASATAVKTAANHVLRHIYLLDLVPSAQPEVQAPIHEVLTAAVNEANDAVLKTVPESGTTLTLAVVIGQQTYFAHVGDSRAYIYHEGVLKQITQDHSVVARMVEVGQLTQEEASTHQNRNVLYRAIGQTNILEVETYLHPLQSHSYLLLCSDGLWNLVSDEEVSHILALDSSLDDRVDKLIDMANDKGGDDNISVILVGLGEDA